MFFFRVSKYPLKLNMYCKILINGSNPIFALVVKVSSHPSPLLIYNKGRDLSA